MWILLLCLSATIAQNITSCVSGNIGFSPIRLSTSSPAFLDYNLHDISIVNPSNVIIGPNGASLSISNGNGISYGSSIETTRLFQYGKIQATLVSPIVPGTVVTVSSKTENGERMSLNLFGSDPNNAYLSIVSRGFQASPISISVPGGTGISHTYAFNKTTFSLEIMIDGIIVYAIPSLMGYPTSPSRLEISLWDGYLANNLIYKSKGPLIGNGSPFSLLVQNIDIMCFNNNNEPVTGWPLLSPPGSITYGPPSVNIPATSVPCNVGSCNLKSSNAALVTVSPFGISAGDNNMIPSRNITGTITPKNNSPNISNTTDGVFTPQAPTSNHAITIGFSWLFMLVLVALGEMLI